MAHQDRRHRAISPASLEAVFAWLLPDDFRFVRHGNASIEPAVLIAQAIATWGWAAGRTLSNRLKTAAAAIRRIFPGQPVATRQGLCQALGSERLTGATLDRLTHRCHILEASGESYRLQDAQRRRGRGRPTAAKPA